MTNRPRTRPTPAPRHVPSLTDAVGYAFAEGGPVQTAMGQYRQLQETAAVGLANYVQNETLDETIPIWIQQQRAGIGKTLAVLLILAFDNLLNNRSGLVSTFTRAMRLSYLREREHVNRIVEDTLRGLGATHLVRPILIGEHQSTVPYISPSKIAHVEEELQDGHYESSREIRELIDFFHQAEDHGREPTFDEYFAQGGVLPRNTDPLYWCICAADQNTSLWQSIIDSNQEAHDADILLTTHAMLIRSNIAGGMVLRTNQDENEDVRRGILIIDEADKLPQVAFDTLTMGISHNHLESLLNEFTSVQPATPEGQRVFRVAERHVRDGMNFAQGFLRSNVSRPLIMDRDDPLATNFAASFDKIELGMGMLREIVTGRYHRDDRNVLIADRITNALDAVRVVANLGAITFPKIGVEAFRDPDGKADLRVFVNFAAGRDLINQLWRTRQSGTPLHGFSGVAFISATLTDLPPRTTSYQWLKRAIGFGDSDQSIEMPPIPTNVRRFPYGMVREVAVVTRDWPHPTDDGNPPTYINAEFVACGARALISLAARQQKMSDQTRMLILCPSFDLADAFYAAVPELHARLIKRDRNANLFTDIARYAKMPHGIWIGVEWEGVNFVEPDMSRPRTLADMLVLTRIPQPPTNQVRRARIADGLGNRMGVAAAERRAEAYALYEGVGQAYRRMTQGVGRAIRNPHDVVQLLAILDFRFPVPLHVADTRKIARSGGDPTKMFTHFDQILDPYDVRRWSQIDKEGNITSIID